MMNDLISKSALLASTDKEEIHKYEIALFPTIDAVPVVRCKDCKHNYSKKHSKRYNHEDILCDYWETDGLNDNDFCSYGERSEE